MVKQIVFHRNASSRIKKGWRRIRKSCWCLEWYAKAFFEFAKAKCETWQNKKKVVKNILQKNQWSLIAWYSVLNPDFYGWFFGFGKIRLKSQPEMLVISGLTSADFFEGYFYQLVFLEGWQSPNLLLSLHHSNIKL